MHQRGFYFLLLTMLFFLYTCKKDPSSFIGGKPIVSIVFPTNNSDYKNLSINLNLQEQKPYFISTHIIDENYY